MEHPPYPMLEYLNDGLWVLAFLLAIPLVLFSDLSWRFVFCGSVGFLLWAKGQGWLLSSQTELVLLGLALGSVVGLFSSCRRVVPPRWRNGLAEGFLGSLGVIALAWGIYALLLVKPPPPWAGVREGMRVEQVHQVLGAPAYLATKTKMHQGAQAVRPRWHERWTAEGTLNQVHLTLHFDESNRVEQIKTQWVPKGVSYRLGLASD